MSTIREIAKKVESPALSPKLISLITDVCFGHECFEPGHYEAVLIFGTPHEVNQRLIADLLPNIIQLHNPSTVYITGGPCGIGLAESEQILQLIGPEKYGSVNFKVDPISTNTKENVEQAMILGLAVHQKIIFVAKTPHYGRCWLTLRKYLPNAILKGNCYDPILSPGLSGARNSWWQFPEIRNLMWAEFLRIELYGGRHDIDYPEVIRTKVERVRELIQD
jgi:hypothetical protein